MVSDPGLPNPGDGPDFTGAKVLMDDHIALHGDIEIHVNEGDWYRHGHHDDKRYNSVILHVVLHGSGKRAQSLDGHRPPTIIIAPYLSADMLQPYRYSEGQACAGAIKYISPEAVRHQFEKAKKEYFGGLVGRLNELYDPILTVSEAWKKILLMAFAGGLGISRNRMPMEHLGRIIHEKGGNVEATNLDIIKNHSGLYKEVVEGGLRRQDWDLSSVRPVNRPEKHFPTLAWFSACLKRMSLREFLRNPEKTWYELVPHKGRRMDLLHLIVYQPALYLLGTLLHDKNLCDFAYRSWENHRYRPDPVFGSSFSAAGFDDMLLPEHLGMVYQKKHYCEKKGCENCLIYKEVSGQ